MYPGVLNSAFASGQHLSPLANAVRAVLSAELLYAALPRMRMEQFAARRTELNTLPGKQIDILKVGSIRKGTRLDEGVPIRAKAMTTSMESVVVYEWGNAIGITEALAQFSMFDVFMMASILLGRDLAITVDMALRDTLFGATNVVYGGGRTSRGTVTSADVFDTQLVKDAVETLEINNAPKFGGDHYVCFLHPHQARTIRDDAAWINAAHYAYQGAGADNPVYTGEVGRYEDTRFIATTMCPNGSNSTVDPVTTEYADLGYSPALDGAGSGADDIYQSAFFGERAYGFAVGLNPEMRQEVAKDFGREHGIAWYSIFGSKNLENSNIVLGETS